MLYHCLFLSCPSPQPFENKCQTLTFLSHLILWCVFPRSRTILLHSHSTLIKSETFNNDTTLVSNSAVYIKIVSGPQTLLSFIAKHFFPVQQPIRDDAFNSSHGFWGSFSLVQLLSLSLCFMRLTFLNITDQFLCKMSPEIWVCLIFPCWLHSGGQNTIEVMSCLSTCIVSEGTRGCLSYYWREFYHLVKVNHGILDS